MNDILFIAGITAFVMFCSIFCMMMVRRRFGVAELSKHNDVAGFIYSVVGVIYAVLLAFVVIVEWELYRDAESRAHEEVRCMASVFRDVRAFSGRPEAAAIQEEIIAYSTRVINEEWPMMAEGNSSPEALRSVHRIFDLTLRLRPQNEYESIWYREIVSNLNDFSDARNQRILAGKEGVIPPFMWSVMIIGGIVTIGFSFLFGTSNSMAQSLMVGALACIITLVLLVIVAFDNPYKGIIRVKSEPFIEQLAHFKGYLSPQKELIIR
ncbi:DUF4239 domain-containing protein [Chlorobium sp. BLA1]|uniref:bestrophin-like domain n=1 Tax=Candidatus Chlorobium masyuteum TaxID=2716876 RepID=UPI00141E8C0D|nr:DUF4239 domain-containing protein [Candidatus Chlorobium masyuteum]NHQ60890.1 DUF4239 domain-containing protein [Candidatus Chlorobium masyuteum]